MKPLARNARRRYLQASFAGPNSGSVAVVSETDITLESNGIWVDITP